MGSEEPLLVVVAGPTGSGKSDLALSLAMKMCGEIVNCDSVQLYRYLDIGSARTPPDQRRGIPHHLLGFLDPDQHFTAGDYARAARSAVRDIAHRNRIPFVTGGTGFYLRALLDGLFEGPARDIALRERLARRSSQSLHRILTRLDEPAARRIHPNDRNKLIRALEVCLLARRPMTELFASSPAHGLQGFRVCKIWLDPDRQELNERINQRCIRMFDTGLIEEVQRILALGFAPDARALVSIGYREAVRHLSGDLSRAEAIASTQSATRQYAKRQRTWFRREAGTFRIRGFGDSDETVRQALAHVEIFGKIQER